MMSDVTSQLRDLGALLEGHFLLSSGRHSPIYVEKFELVQRPLITVELLAGILDQYREQRVDTVAGPTTGGAILAFEAARQLGVRNIFAERSADGGREFRRGFRISEGEQVLVVDDVLTTGGSVRQTVHAVKDLGGVVIGAGVLIDRSGGTADAGAPYTSALRLSVPTYEPANCPQCAAGLPLEKRGTTPTAQRA